MLSLFFHEAKIRWTAQKQKAKKTFLSQDTVLSLENMSPLNCLINQENVSSVFKIYNIKLVWQQSIPA